MIDWDLVTTVSLAGIFWFLMFVEMAFASALFINLNSEYDEFVWEFGVRTTNVGLVFIGFLAMGLPVVQAGLWLHYSVFWAWGLVIVPIVLGLFFLALRYFE